MKKLSEETIKCPKCGKQMVLFPYYRLNIDDVPVVDHEEWWCRSGCDHYIKTKFVPNEEIPSKYLSHNRSVFF